MSTDGATDQDRCRLEKELTVLNIVIATPKARGGAVRAGLQLGDYLSEFVNVDTVKMRGDYDESLLNELKLANSIHSLSSLTALRDSLSMVMSDSKNYSNTLIGTKLTPPRPIDQYDIAHIHNPVPLAGMVSVALTCRLNNLPYCVTTHGISKIPELPESMGMSKPVEKLFHLLFERPYFWVLREAAHLFSLSSGDVQRLNTHLPNQSISVVPNGVRLNPPDIESESIVFDETGLQLDKPTLLFVGKLMESKGVDDLLTAYDNLNFDCSILIVGPVENKKYENVAGDDSDIHHLGYINQDLLDALYRASDIFVFPTRSDVFPLVNLEAMAAGTPVISTSVGGIPEQITDQTGILVSPGDPENLATAIETLLNDDQCRNMMAKQSYLRAANEFSWRSVAEQTAEKYIEIIQQTEMVGR
ncbi:glycosyltransferase family 4 protein [Halomarina rubra]|uniref:Glycosyltransferase family 4 protein n=1 Tax=Halomarina rubra TaxID=2071873 RepID=A0ABD6AWZ0_9EURY|nr:glycosyltransferase family 4 protein [Halomarina rubra]